MEATEMLRFACPSCQGTLKARVDAVGRRARCTRCGALVVVPGLAVRRDDVALVSPKRAPGQSAPPPPANVGERPPARPHNRAILLGWAAAALAGLGLVGLVLRTGHRDPASRLASSTPAPAPQASSATTKGSSTERREVPAATKSQEAKGRPTPPQESSEAKAIAALPLVKLGPAELRAALAKGVKVTGTLQPEDVQQFNQSYHRWNADVRLENASAVTLGLGSDLMLIEMPLDGTSYNGLSVFLRKPARVGPESYGLDSNYEMENHRINIGGGMVTYTFLPDPAESFGVLAAKPWTLKREFPEYTWKSEESLASVCLVFPELRVRTTAGTARFRLLADFEKPKSGRSWSFRDQRLVPIDPETLKATLADAQADVVRKVLAANWLVERTPEEAPAALARAAAPLREGPLLGASLLLMNTLKAAGLESHAVELLEDPKVPNGIRLRAAEYLGAVHHEPGLEPVIAATQDKDDVVVKGAIVGLGSYGGPRAIEALAAILRDGQRQPIHSQAAENLARTKDPAAVRILEDLATAGNAPALQALAGAEIPDTFDFFVRLADDAKEPNRRDQVARGLKASGGDKALPVLLRMVEAAEPAPETNTSGDGLTQVLAEMDKPEATPKLIALARAGNVRAAQALAGSKNASVRKPLQELTGSTATNIRRIAVEGLRQHWAAESVDVFGRCVEDADAAVVLGAMGGLETSKDARAPGFLVPLLRHQTPNIRQSAASYLRNLALPPALVPRVAEALLAHEDDHDVSSLVEILIRAKWNDRTAIGRLGKTLGRAKSYERDYVRLLRHLSGNAMGPADDGEYYKDPKGWGRKWVDWAARQAP